MNEIDFLTYYLKTTDLTINELVDRNALGAICQAMKAFKLDDIPEEMLSVTEKLKRLNKKANDIFNHVFLTWKEKYDQIISDEIFKEVYNLIYLEYYDPDTDYEEDVTAFMNAFNERMKNLNELN
jgi:hypothetical protein